MITPRGVRIQLKLADDIGKDSPFYDKIQKLKERRREWVTKQEQLVRALETKQAGAKGNTVVFASRRFDGYDPVEAQTSGLDCAKVFWKTYGPKGGHKIGNGAYHFKTLVDGKQCTSTSGEYRADYTAAWPIKLGGPISLGRLSADNHCFDQVSAAGEHRVTVEIAKAMPTCKDSNAYHAPWLFSAETRERNFTYAAKHAENGWDHSGMRYERCETEGDPYVFKKVATPGDCELVLTVKNYPVVYYMNSGGNTRGYSAIEIEGVGWYFSYL